MKSKVTLAKLQPFIDAGLLPSATERRWRLPGNEVVLNPEPGETICFTSHLLRGLAYPSSNFLVRFLAYYNIRLYDLSLNSLLALSCYIAYCECFLGCSPNFPLWLSLYFSKPLPEGDESDLLQMTGGICFSSRPGSSSIFLALEPSQKVAGWRSTWFYLRDPTVDAGVTILPFSTERSQPRNLKVPPRAEDESMVGELTRRGKHLVKKNGLVAANLYTCWISRRLSPLKQWPALMCAYTGLDNPCRDHPQDLTLQDLVFYFPTYTKVVSKSMEAGMLPYTASHQAPPVSRRVFASNHFSIDRLL